MKTQTKTIIVIISAAIALLVALCLYRLRPITQQEMAESEVVVEREESYLLMAGEDTLLAFSRIEGDSLLLGGMVSADSVSRVTIREKGLWVNAMPILPSCRGRIMLTAPDTSRLCHTNTEQLRTIMEKQKARVAQLSHFIASQQRDIHYYLRTHNVTDMGFDVVARADKRLSQAADSLARISRVLTSIPKDKPLQLRLNPIYYAYVKTDSSTQRVECRIVQQRDSLILIRTLGNRVSAAAATRLHPYSTEEIRTHLVKNAKPHLILPKDTRLDTLGIYRGALDTQRQAHGYGILVGPDGSSYEGEWQHGKRTGWGLSLTSGKRMRIGEWQDDRYLGERITYTSERIYGIDISRFQHEKGRRRYKIDWDRLAITSLGHISKKKIQGTVHYPISFIYIKSTEGTSVKNKYFFADYREARKRHYKVGAYHFFSTRTSGTAQATFFLRNSRYQSGDFPPVLDVEPTAAQIRAMGGKEVLIREVRRWLHSVEQALHVRPILYVSQSFVTKYLAAAPDLIHDHHVWIARYGEYKPDLNLIYWQLSPDGRVQGIQTEVDINVFNGFKSEWNNFCAGQ